MKTRSPFARAWSFLNFKPVAKWVALVAAVGTGLLYIALLVVLALFADRASAARVVSSAPQRYTIEPVLELLAVLGFPGLDGQAVLLQDLVPMPLVRVGGDGYEASIRAPEAL